MSLKIVSNYHLCKIWETNMVTCHMPFDCEKWNNGKSHHLAGYRTDFELLVQEQKIRGIRPQAPFLTLACH